MMFGERRQHEWRLRTRGLALGRRTLVMGVLNVTPDSFSDGGEYVKPEKAVERALVMLEEGAEIIDIGGESTRPGRKATVAAAEEQRRVVQVIEGVLALQPEAVVSVDTYRAETARLALEAGAEIVNDVSGLLWDAEMAQVCAESGCGLVLMHTRGRPEEWAGLPELAAGKVVPLVKRELAERLQAAAAMGIRVECVAVDAGLGFGKMGAANWELIAGMGEIVELGRPVVVGASRKGFVGAAIEVRTGEAAGAKERLHGTLAAHTAAILAGASVVRAHDVRAAVEAAAVADAVLAGVQ
jgi:dihydropteroate synthase